MTISELQLNIFQLVDIDSARKKTLLALALTCTSFTGMALDLLWRNLDNFNPLIKCLPSSLWKITRKGNELYAILVFEFIRAMNADDWSIFCKYNHRVHSIDMAHESGHGCTKIWDELGHPPFSLPLLPNLTSLTWSVYDWEYPDIQLFATQTLTTFNIHGPVLRCRWNESYGATSVRSISSRISTLCPSLSHFSFHGLSSIYTSTALQCWPHLLSVRTGTVSNAAILHLAGLPSLQELHIELLPIPIDAETRKLLQYPAFCALRELSVTGSLPPLDTFLGALSIAPKILSIIIEDSDNIVSNVTEDFAVSVTHISNACAHGALEDLQIYVKKYAYNTLNGAAFEPLCAFHNLRKFHFRAQQNVRLEDTILVRMAKAWPHLEYLAIHAREDNDIVDCGDTTVYSFISLLQHCPRLNSVAIAIDWSALDQRYVFKQLLHQGFVHDTLTTANFCRSRICYTKRVAAFIAAIAPKLRKFTYDNFSCMDSHTYLSGGGHEYDRPLEECEKSAHRLHTVERLLNASSKVREQEQIKISNAGGSVGDLGTVGRDPENDNEVESDSDADSE